MPFYEYECANCKFYTEVLQKLSDPPLKKCPSCGKAALKKLISAPVFRLKGSGWYETDFKSDNEQKRNLVGDDPPPADKTEGKAEAKSDAPGEAKTDAKSEPKPEGKSDAKAKSPEPAAAKADSGAAAGAPARRTGRSAPKPAPAPKPASKPTPARRSAPSRSAPKRAAPKARKKTRR